MHIPAGIQIWVHCYPCPPLRHRALVLPFYPRWDTRFIGNPSLERQTAGLFMPFPSPLLPTRYPVLTGWLVPFPLAFNKLYHKFSIPPRTDRFPPCGRALYLGPLTYFVGNPAGEGWLPLNSTCSLPESGYSSTPHFPEAASANLEKQVSTQCFWHYPKCSFQHWAFIASKFYSLQVSRHPPQHCRVEVETTRHVLMNA